MTRNGITTRIDTELNDLMIRIANENKTTKMQVSRDVARLVRQNKGKKMSREKILREIRF